MKNYILTISVMISVASILACKKEKPIKPFNISIGVPFELNIKDTGIMTDAGQSYKLYLSNIEDYRAFGDDCMFSWGGYAAMSLLVESEDSITALCKLGMPGCTSGGEYDTINPNTPKCLYSGYKICLLKLNPHDRLPENKQDYSAKYVIKNQ